MDVWGPHDSEGFWRGLDALIERCSLMIDRPRGSAHPRYPDFIYPYDYGYLEGTRSADGGGVDVWVGSVPAKKATAVICTIDLEKRHAEIKVLLGCTTEEARQILAIHNDSSQSGILIERVGSKE